VPRRIREERQRRRYRKHEFIHLCNTLRQYELFAAAGLDAVFCNQNALVDERIFRPLPYVEKCFDAVYDARLNPYKRHHLASEIQSLALIHATSSAYDEPDYAINSAHREAFIDTVQSIYDRERITRRFAEEWPALRFNQILRHQRHADTIAALEGRRQQTGTAPSEQTRRVRPT
jgi:hypothetical protein